MNVLLVGAGTQGAPCAAILARDPRVGRVVVGSRDGRAAQAVCGWAGSDKLSAAAFDARQPETLLDAVGNALDAVDVVIDLTPTDCSLGVMRAALMLGAHYVNTAACVQHLDQWIARAPLALGEQFLRAGRTALLGCGASPGVANLLCRRHCEAFDAVRRIDLRFGMHVPSQKSATRTWTPTWSVEEQLRDYWHAPCVFEDGRHRRLPRFHEPERYEFDTALGTLELAHHCHDEVFSLPLALGRPVDQVSFKYPVDPTVATLLALGFTPEREIELQGVKLRPVDVLAALLPPPGAPAMQEPDAQRWRAALMADVRLHILIDGLAGGRARRIRVSSGLYFDEAAKALALYRTANVPVAYAAVTGALLLAQGRSPAGIAWPEQLDPDRFFALAGSLGLSLRSRVTTFEDDGTERTEEVTY